MKILIIGDIYGKTGRDSLQRLFPALMSRYQPDWVIANGENVTAGNGLSQKHANFLKSCGVDIITTGNHVFSRSDWPE
ncbi:MAG TPA: YmdB family metallophosphoesterase, partial [Candidatus Rifleibacterium sp.]|nr:YmdB family metallophosphoesterase [Candidatus Rifleibacterium sp.]